jgi:molybdopterin-guanine dinucleotide biosynthesis protein A
MTHACSAVVLAAGRSTRMGRDKALLEIGGVPWWQRQRDVLAAAGATEVFLSARPDQTWTRQAAGFAAVIHDALPDGGPLVGITAGLEHATQPWLMVLAVDLAVLPPAWFTQLQADCAPGVGVIGRRDGLFEPLAAIYPREFKWLAWEALARGEFACQRLAAAAVTQGLLRVREISATEADWLANWNSPDEIKPRS